MTFVDTNVFMYAVGRPHPLQSPAREFFFESNVSRTPLFTSAEVLQELAYAYLPAGRLQTLDAALSLVVRSRVEVWPLEQEDVNLARLLHEQYPTLEPRDLPSRQLPQARHYKRQDIRSSLPCHCWLGTPDSDGSCDNIMVTTNLLPA